jgi:hypothetical protein
MIKKVLILASSNNLLHRQLSKNENLIEDGYIFQIGQYSEGFDYLVVIDNYDEVIKINYPKNNIILFTGEPPTVKRYPSKYLNQFGSIFTCQKDILKRINAYLSIPPLPWMTGCRLIANTHIYEKSRYMTYEDFQKFENHERIDKICLITSNKKFTKGHRQRVNFALKLKKTMPDKVDIYGNGFMSIPDKFEIQSQYKYSIVIENCAYPDYWTEKLADTYLAGGFPIYYGAPNIEKYFSSDELRIIDINDFKSSLEVIKDLLNKDLYNNSRIPINDAKLKILNQYNTFSIIASCLNKIQYTGTNEILSHFNPLKFSILDIIKQKIIKYL